MQISNGALFFGAGIEMNEWRKNVNEMRRDILGLKTKTEKETQQMDNAFKTLSVGIGAYFSANALQGFAQQLINVRGEFQKTEIAFSTMLQSKEKAKELMSQMVDLTAKTPFGLQDVTDGAKRLLAFQVPANEVVETLRRMGDVAAGLGVPLGQLIHVYGQVKAQGKLMTNDLYQFMNAGIPILAELSKVMGKSEAEIKKMVGEGKIGFTEIQQVIQNMTNEGGLFFNLMSEQSESLSGKVANLGDAWDQMLNKIGESNEGLLADGIEGLTYLVENYEDYIHVLVELIAVYGTYRTALILTSALQGKMVAPAVIQGFSNLISVIKGATTAQKALNVAGMANPYVFLATVIASLIAVTYNYRKELRELLGIIEKETVATKVQAEIQKQYDEKFSKGITEKRAQIQGLIAVINNENSTLEQRKSAYEKLITIDPSFRGALDSQYKATYRLTDAFDAVIKKMQTFALAQARMAAVKDILEKNAKAQMDYALAKTKYNDAVRREKELRNNPDSFNILKEEFGDPHKLSSAVVSAQKEAESAAKKANIALKIQSQELDYQQKKYNEIQELEKKGWRMSNGKKYAEKYIEEFKQVRNQAESILTSSGILNNSTPPLTTPNLSRDEKGKGSKRELAEVYSKDSIKDLEQRISLWNNALDRAYKNEKGELVTKKRAMDKYGKESDTKEVVTISEIKRHLQNLESKKRELQKQLSIKTYREELDEAERHWNNYYKIAQHYGEESAKSQYAELLKGHRSYLSYLEAEVKALESRDILSEEDKGNLVFLHDKIQSLSGNKTPLENWKTELEESLRGVRLISEQIEVIDAKVSEVFQKEGNSINFLQFNKDAEQRTEQLKSQLKSQYHSFLEEHSIYEEKRTALTKKYAELRAIAESEAERKKIDKAEQKALGDLDADMIKQSAEWQIAFEEMEGLSNTSLQRILQRLLEFKEKSKGTLSVQDSAELGNVIQKVQKALNRNPFKGILTSFKEYFASTKQAKKAQEEYNEAIQDYSDNSDEVEEASQRMIDADKKVLDARQELIASFSKAQTLFNDIGQGVMDIADAFGGLDEASKDAVEDIMAIGNAALDLGKSLASGDVAGAIQAGIRLIGKVFKALTGDKRKERRIKRHAKALNELKQAYEDLAHASKKALGSQKYDNSRDQIRNLQAQNNQLQEMVKTEGDKKKVDKKKIEEWENQIKNNQRIIDDFKDDIIKDVLQTDIVNAAAKVGDALVDAFSRGEDSVKALKNTANDMIKSLLKNQLNLVLQNKLKPIMNNLLRASGFDENGEGSFRGLSREQIERFKEQIANAGMQMQSFLEATREVWQGDGLEVEGLKGAMKGMSEETGGLMAGQFNAVRINTADTLKIWQEFKNKNFGLDIAKDTLLEISRIEYNTSQLIAIRKDIAELNNKIKGDGVLRALGY